ncbi:hypothetical protein ACFWBV_08785 [Streptomyces sp. NPDC060030]|uniref:hypothetical protein n=1 Tax=Streptomyces sp. NPDC060030 TaxID=3347042 RepID=UPI0036B847D6
MRRQDAGHRPVRRAEYGAEEYIQDPHEQDQHGAVDRVRDQGADQRTDRQVDHREHQRPGQHPPRIVPESGPQLKGEQGSGGGQQRQCQAGGHTGRHQPGGGQPGQNQAAVRGAGAAHLEVHGDRGDEAGSPPGGGGLHRRTAGAAEQLGGIRHRSGGHHHEHHRHQNQHQQVDRGTGGLDEEPADERQGRHRATARPSRS